MQDNSVQNIKGYQGNGQTEKQEKTMDARAAAMEVDLAEDNNLNLSALQGGGTAPRPSNQPTAPGTGGGSNSTAGSKNKKRQQPHLVATKARTSTMKLWNNCGLDVEKATGLVLNHIPNSQMLFFPGSIGPLGICIVFFCSVCRQGTNRGQLQVCFRDLVLLL